METVELKLYVMGQTPQTEQAREDLQRLCDEHLAGCHTIEVIDVSAHPEVVEQENILATPTVVKVAPGPSRRIVGDLSDMQRVRRALGLDVADVDQ